MKKHYLESDIDVKNKLIGSIFPEKIIYSENKYQTKNTNSFFHFKNNVKEGFERLYKAKGQHFC
ncbi:hypothetical protein ASF92_03900 [Pedobacter sp. Leaf176]|nr:hypothetical protein ASF92_03900 [Pedobacter sp. Leaf176]